MAGRRTRLLVSLEKDCCTRSKVCTWISKLGEARKYRHLERTKIRQRIRRERMRRERIRRESQEGK